MYTITRTYEFSAAHRILGHPKCGRMHGHNYKVEVCIASNRLDLQGMVLDYGKMDDWIKPVIEKLDHRYLLSNKEMGPGYDLETIDGDTFDLEAPFSTGECISERLFWMIRGRRPSSVEVIWVKLWETSRSSAIFVIPEDIPHPDWPRSTRFVSDSKQMEDE